MKHILITGGAGFIGSHLTEFLLKSGYHVTVVDNLQTGSLSNLAFCKDHPEFSFLQQDVCDPLDLEVDEIYHLACPASPVHYQADPIKTTKTCVLGSLNVLELAKKNRSRVLSASTSEVYGDPLVHPQVESDWGNVNPVGIRSCYDEGKRCAETLFMDYHRSHKLNIKIARIFNTYGPNMASNDGRVISNIILQSLKGDIITIYGNGNQTRSFMYIDDLVNALILLMNSDDNFQGPVNLGNPNELTVMALAKKIIDQTNSNSKIIKMPLPEDDPLKRKPDISLAIEKLGWEPRIELKKGLDKTIKYFSELIKNNKSER